MRRRTTRALVVVMLVSLVAAACGDGNDGSLSVTDVWSRASSSNAGALYMTITGGDVGTALTSVAVPAGVAPMSMLHQTAIGSEGAMSMSPVQSIEIPAGTTVSLAPGGYHVMMMNLVEPLVVGDTFDVVLTFSNGTQMTVQADVRDQ